MKIGVNSDLNIPVRRSAPKHNLGTGAVKLPHSGVERKYIEPLPGTSKNNSQETKETRVVKSEKRETSEASEASEAKTVSPSHETNLNVLIIVAGRLAWFLFR